MSEEEVNQSGIDVPDVLSQFDYVVRRGQCYRVDCNNFDEGQYLVEVDEIPDNYWNRWRDADDE
jgi:hypothetical protein